MGGSEDNFKLDPRSDILDLKLFLLILALGLCSSCATSFDAKGRYHRVQSGETIWKIASAYRVPVQDLAELNNVQDGNKLEPGQKLYLPPRPKGRVWKKLPKEEQERAYSAPIETDRGRFIWPVDGDVLSNFGIRNGRRHDGIDISARAGTPIRAAGDGKVVFSSRLGGYGNTIIVRHSDNFFTTYAHNRRNMAKKGQNVKKGDVIAQLGATGNATGAHCHFEIRHRQKARNPLFFLPVKR
jgi:murein DD-endopeptidase MepM/ murein hydrolase activator NlpD